MNSLEAAYLVLKEAAQPLRAEEITKRIIEQRLWETAGKTPVATVEANLNTDIKEKGTSSRFLRVDKGTFILNELAATNQPTIQSPPKILINIPPQTSVKTLSFTDAAEHVLEKYGKKQPMHYKTITEKAIELGLIATAGQTPDLTMNAQILNEIHRVTRRGEQPRFVKCGKGYIGLTRWKAKGLTFQIEQHNKEIQKKLHEYICAIKPSEFEALIGRLLTAMGFDLVSVTPLNNDGGIDVRGTLVVGETVRIRMAVQVKRWKANVQSPVVQQVRGSLGAHEQGLIITTSDFSSGARDEAERSDATPVALMNGEQLVNLLIENDICIRRTNHDLIELGEVEDEA
ncbi:MAG TPA: restriction endonuclease [Firmicutes bacterium]|nr:restriction endonuclease [Bacillota bacterium]